MAVIGLTGLLGVGSSDISNLFSNGLGWSAGANLLSPLFEWGKNARRVDIERERAKQYMLRYEKTVLFPIDFTFIFKFIIQKIILLTFI